MKTTYKKKLLIWAALSLLFVFMFGSKTSAAKLFASDPAALDFFGGSISISGDVAVVGAPNPPSSIYQGLAGCAYVYRYNVATSTWEEEQKLFASDGFNGNSFGSSVSIDGNVILVGANTDDDQGYRSGSVYVFRYEEDPPGSGIWGWLEKGKLPATTDAAANDFFGFSVSIEGDVAVVGAVFKEFTGAAYVYRYNVATSTWEEEQRLLPSLSPGRFDFFGFSVSISGDMALVGVPQDDDNGIASGSVYVFRYEEDPPGSGIWGWVEKPKLLASDGAAQEQFGDSLFFSGDMAVVGAPSVGGACGTYAGSAYVFRYEGGTWVQKQKLVAPDGAACDQFGSSVSFSGDIIVVGAFADDDVNPNEDVNPNSGSAYVFRYNVATSTWDPERKLLDVDGAANDIFGASIANSGDMIFVGAPNDDDLGSNSGSVSVFFPDSDSDGIHDPVDLDPLTSSTLFSDGTTSGAILSVDTGIIIQILDAPDPADGVAVLVWDPDSTGGGAVIRIDGSPDAEHNLTTPGAYKFGPGSLKVTVRVGTDTVYYQDLGVTILVDDNVEVLIHETYEGDVHIGLSVEENEGSVTVTVNGEIVELDDSGTIIQPVSIDIKPGSGDLNCINPDSGGMIAVAIICTEDVDVSNIDQSSIEIDADADSSTSGVSPTKCSIKKDLGGSKASDLVCHFKTSDSSYLFDGADHVEGKTLYVTGTSDGGTPILGSDIIHIAGESAVCK